MLKIGKQLRTLGLPQRSQVLRKEEEQKWVPVRRRIREEE
jgi:hypothetical protein